MRRGLSVGPEPPAQNTLVKKRHDESMEDSENEREFYRQIIRRAKKARPACGIVKNRTPPLKRGDGFDGRVDSGPRPRPSASANAPAPGFLAADLGGISHD